MASWCRHGGVLVAPWWRHGGVIVALWWRRGGVMMALVYALKPKPGVYLSITNWITWLKTRWYIGYYDLSHKLIGFWPVIKCVSLSRSIPPIKLGCNCTAWFLHATLDLLKCFHFFIIALLKSQLGIINYLLTWYFANSPSKGVVCVNCVISVYFTTFIQLFSVLCNFFLSRSVAARSQEKLEKS